MYHVFGFPRFPKYFASCKTPINFLHIKYLPPIRHPTKNAKNTHILRRYLELSLVGSIVLSMPTWLRLGMQSNFEIPYLEYLDSRREELRGRICTACGSTMTNPWLPLPLWHLLIGDFRVFLKALITVAKIVTVYLFEISYLLLYASISWWWNIDTGYRARWIHSLEQECLYFSFDNYN